LTEFLSITTKKLYNFELYATKNASYFSFGEYAGCLSSSFDIVSGSLSRFKDNCSVKEKSVQPQIASSPYGIRNMVEINGHVDQS